jgi:hypothetical protein
MRQMSPHLQGEVAWALNQRWLDKVWFLQLTELTFTIQISKHLFPMVFPPGEVITRGPLYIINKGLLIYAGRVLTAAQAWGEDMILAETLLQRRESARTLTYLDVHQLTRETLLAIVIDFPESAQLLRRAAVKLAIIRFVKAAAKIAKRFGTLQLETISLSTIEEANSKPASWRPSAMWSPENSATPPEPKPSAWDTAFLDVEVKDVQLVSEGARSLGPSLSTVGALRLQTSLAGTSNSKALAEDVTLMAAPVSGTERRSNLSSIPMNIPRGRAEVSSADFQKLTQEVRDLSTMTLRMFNMLQEMRK